MVLEVEKVDQALALTMAAYELALLRFQAALRPSTAHQG